MPQHKYVLSSVTKSDGMEGSDDGAHSYTDTYSFSGGYYDRIV
jgi:hypothetical protein